MLFRNGKQPTLFGTKTMQFCKKKLILYEFIIKIIASLKVHALMAASVTISTSGQENVRNLHMVDARGMLIIFKHTMHVTQNVSNGCMGVD